MAAKILVIACLLLCAASVYFNRRNDAWADRCLLLAYTALIVSVFVLWR